MNIDSVLELIEELKVFALKLQEQNENEKIKIVTKYEDEEEFLVIHQIDNIQYYISKVKKAGIKRSLERSKEYNFLKTIPFSHLKFNEIVEKNNIKRKGNIFFIDDINIFKI